MPRLAGNESYYSFRLVGPDGVTEYGWDLPSVTSIIKETTNAAFGAASGWGHNLAVSAWAEFSGDSEATIKKRIKELGKTPNQQLNVRTDSGKRAHDILEALAKGQDVGMLEEDGYAYGVSKAWHDQMGAFEILDAERPVVSLAGAYSGTLDLFYRDTDTGEVRVLDLKTHKPMSSKRGYRDDDALQVAAYADAIEEMRGIKVHGGDILLTNERGGYTLEAVENWNSVREAWRHLLAMYQSLHGRGRAL